MRCWHWIGCWLARKSLQTQVPSSRENRYIRFVGHREWGVLVNGGYW